MRFVTVIIVSLASICRLAAALGPVYNFTVTAPTLNETVLMNSLFNITWFPGSYAGPVGIELYNGFTPVSAVASNLYSFTSFNWQTPTLDFNDSAVFALWFTEGAAEDALDAFHVSPDFFMRTALSQSTTQTSQTTPLTSSTSSASALPSSQTSTSIANSQTATPSSSSTSSALTQSLGASTHSPTATQTPNKGLTIGTKAGIGIGATLRIFFIFGLIAYFFYHQGRRHAAKNSHLQEKGIGPNLGKAELGTGEMGEEVSALTAEERLELERRRRAAEVDGVELMVGPVEIEGNESLELEAWRRQDDRVFEML